MILVDRKLRGIVFKKLAIIFVIIIITFVNLYVKDNLSNENVEQSLPSFEDNHSEWLVTGTEDNLDETEPLPTIEYNQFDDTSSYENLRVRNILASNLFQNDAPTEDNQSKSKSSSSQSEGKKENTTKPVKHRIRKVKPSAKKKPKVVEKIANQTSPIKPNVIENVSKETTTTSSTTIKTEEKAKNSTECKGNGTDSSEKCSTHHIKPPATMIPILKNEKIRECTPPAYKEFPNDIFGHKLRKHGFIIIHIAVACYMFYCLAIVCDHYFLTSLEECAMRLGLSEDVAGATLMAAGSSGPELFIAILGVFVAKGDVGTGTIVGSAVFNILFVIGLCAILTASTPLNWWPVARDSTYYTFTVLVLIIVAYDGEVNKYESCFMLILYVVYIIIMHFNVQIRELVLAKLTQHIGLIGGETDSIKAHQAVYYHSIDGQLNPNALPPSLDLNRTSLYEAANYVIIKHKRLFPGITRFRAAAHLIITMNIKHRPHTHQQQKQRQQEFNYKHTESFYGKSKMSRERVTQSPNIDEWSNVPNPVVEGWAATIKWCVRAPLHATLFHTIPSCKERPNLFLLTFLTSILWIAIFSYIMVWMVTLIGYTFGIPDSIMGITFLAAGTSIPDAYASIHVARQGQGDMAVSNSIGSNVFDILVGLALPWFIETTLWQPGTVATINSRGLFYAIILLFLSLVCTIFLFHHNRWTLCPKLGYALLITYAVFLIFCGALELNLLGYVNPVMCEE
ncbi:sodium/potassium/calcium exchanger 4-like [Brevipalpus obovatus]|uniref:sodium/potassium/calcium exchanger 4-like n=1 Tax=Brevipalpus obovatus TaxID=246614 RepID=UPI003D9DE876